MSFRGDRSMIRLFLTGAFAFLAYRLARKMIDDVPGDVDPLLLPAPRSDRDALRRQSAAMGVDPRR
ncbi:msr7945 [Mesorhizobium japonicum MAFF 303099]|uniref:Msr7945 protein n=2 Tax=Mesorhizobium TaxID=68287 RepID=Q984L9_RHILO|nr:msr7945 [Mesorhizobium japonicum MAFF 303099]